VGLENNQGIQKFVTYLISPEISGILAKTGAKPYLDEDAAVKYLVYNDNSWISYDDAETFRLKIDYANSMGLGGLMVWAIDQDDSSLTALRAITDSALASDDTAPFNLVDLHRLWSTADYPADDTDPRYGLVNFGSEANLGETSPDKTGFGFFIVSGDSYAVTKLKGRAGEPEPFTFLDCPTNVMKQPDHKAQTARVVCLNQDVEGCFRVMERGVKGTVVEMPENVRFIPIVMTL
jgi:chitinase